MGSTVIHHSDLSLVAYDFWGKTYLVECQKRKLFCKEMWSIPEEKVKKSWFWFQYEILARLFISNMPVQTTHNVYESCGAESLCYWADGWRLKSFSSGSRQVEIAHRWVMTALHKAIYSAVAGRSWPWYTTLRSCLLFPAVILSWLAKSEKSRALLPCMQMTVC